MRLETAGDLMIQRLLLVFAVGLLVAGVRAAMLAGMAVLGGLVSGALAVAGLETPDGPELTPLAMAFSMAAGMVVWMRHRRHAWPSTLEMAGAMFIPALALFPTLWAGAIDGDDLLMLEHVLMLPLMYVVMLRRRGEYGD